MGKIIGIGSSRLHRIKRIVAPGEAAYLTDRVWNAECKGGAPEYNQLVDSEGNGDATIYSTGPDQTYPGGQVFPNTDGLFNYITAGNVEASNISERLAVCMWLQDYGNNGTNTTAFMGKTNGSLNLRQYFFYRWGGYYRFVVSRDGGSSNWTILQFPHATVTGRDIFLCGTYEYVGNGTSKMRFYGNLADAGTLALLASTDVAVGPINTGTASLSLAAFASGGAFGSFMQADIKKVEIFDGDASRIADWTGGTNPELRFVAGSGH